jgi:catechol 2,3-dioxygenase-like lactoylglutathione lyase family enzyme
MKNSFVLNVMIMLASCTSESTTNSDSKQGQRAGLPSDTLPVLNENSFVKGVYPVVITKDILTTQKFYTKWLAFEVVFESTWFVLLTAPGKNSGMIAFMSESHPSTPPSPKAIQGDGMFLTIDVANAGEFYAALKTSGAEFAYELKDEAWGQRRFALTDPNGIWIDVVEQTEPEAGWWDEYMRK